MPGIRSKISTVIPRSRPYPPDARDAARAIRALRIPGGEAIAGGFESLTNSLTTLHRAARDSAPELEEFLVTDHNGRVLAALGQYEVEGVEYSGGYFTELRAGDPYGESNPANAILTVTPDGRVCVGENGWVDVLDPFGESAAWLGCQADTLPVTGAVDNGSGLIRLEVVGHTLLTGDTTTALNVGGVDSATGVFSITKVDADHIDLQNSTFVGSYSGGGTVNRVLHVVNATNNGAGLVRLETAVPHLYETGDKTNAASVGGVPGANGQHIVTVIDATHFDLQGSTFSGAYTSGGVCLRYFAGGLFGTVAVGPSFVDYRARMFSDGSFKIRNATITLDSATGTIQLLPSDPPTIIATDAATGDFIQIIPGVGISQVTGGVPSLPQSSWSVAEFHILNSSGAIVATLKSDTGVTESGSLVLSNSGGTAAVAIDPSNATAAITTTGGTHINVGGAGVYKVAGTQVIKARMAGISAPAGGATVDTQARAAITSIINTLSAAAGGHGLIT
jgi:hypothetical protein